MKDYLVTWYKGSIEGDYIEEVYDKVVLQANSIREVEWLEVLPDNVNLPPYYRVISLREGKISIDYGSHSRFILVEELQCE